VDNRYIIESFHESDYLGELITGIAEHGWKPPPNKLAGDIQKNGRILAA
jgi:hypothetical protein